mgnify:FL=1
MFLKSIFNANIKDLFAVFEIFIRTKNNIQFIMSLIV